jgi:hypothetical protein
MLRPSKINHFNSKEHRLPSEVVLLTGNVALDAKPDSPLQAPDPGSPAHIIIWNVADSQLIRADLADVVGASTEYLVPRER